MGALDGEAGKEGLGGKGDDRLSRIGGLAQLARASALQAEGHRFDSDILHRKEKVH